MLSSLGRQKISSCSCCWRSLRQWNRISMALVRLVCMLFLIRPAAVALSVCSFVGCCLWPSALSVLHIATASRALVYSAAISASVADAITFFIICETAWTAPFRWYIGGDDKKKWPPARDGASSTDRYEASLWQINCISEYLYVMHASGCVAT